MASKAALETALRNDILETITAHLFEHYQTDVLPVSASELMMPLVDAEGNEKYAVIKVSIPRGTRANGTYEPYNGYDAADEYAAELADKEEKARAREEKKARAEAEKKRKAEARKTLKTMKKDVQEVLGTGAGTTAE